MAEKIASLWDGTDLIPPPQTRRMFLASGTLGAGIALLLTASRMGVTPHAVAEVWAKFKPEDYPQFAESLKYQGSPVVVLDSHMTVLPNAIRRQSPFITEENIIGPDKREEVDFPFYFKGSAPVGLGTAPWLGYVSERTGSLHWVCYGSDFNSLGFSQFSSGTDINPRFYAKVSGGASRIGYAGSASPR